MKKTICTAVLSAGLVLGPATLAEAATDPAAASAEGHQGGLIVFASNRTTGEGVENPEGDYEIFTMRPDGSEVRQLTVNTAFDFYPSWSNDGRKIAFETTRSGNSEIFTMDADGANPVNVTNDPAIDRHPTFSADGRRIAFESTRTAGTGVNNPEGDLEIYTIGPDGVGVAQLTFNATFDIQPEWSPNGRRIAFASFRDGTYDVFTMNADGSDQVNRTKDPGQDYGHSWSHDGKRIAFNSSRGGPTEVYTMRANGKKPTRLTTNGLPTDSEPAFSPNGRTIAFQSDRDGNFEIYAMSDDGKNPVNLTSNPGGDFAPDWQPRPC